MTEPKTGHILGHPFPGKQGNSEQWSSRLEVRVQVELTEAGLQVTSQPATIAETHATLKVKPHVQAQCCDQLTLHLNRRGGKAAAP